MILTHSMTELVNIGKQAEDCGARAEIVGGWVWAKFNNKPADDVREKMKALGFHWSKAKSRWYFVGAISTATRRHSWTQICQRYAPQQIDDVAVAAA